MKYFPLVWKNLMRSKRRTVLTVLSSAVLVMLLAVILAIYDYLHSPPEGEGQERRLMVQHGTSLMENLPVAHAAKMTEIPGVQVVCPMSWFQGQYGSDMTDAKNWFGRLAADTNTFFDYAPEFKISKEHREAFLAERQGAIAGKRLVEKMGWKLGDRISIKGDIYPVDLELYLRGIFTTRDPREEENLWFHQKYLDELRGNPGTVGTIGIMCRTIEDVSRVATAVDASFVNSDTPTRTMTEREFNLSFTQMMGNVKLIVISVSFAILFVMALVTANTIAMGTRERTGDAAVMKTLGFVRGQVMSFVLAEGAVQSIVGALLGLFLATGFLNSMGQMGWMAGLFLTPLSAGLAIGCAILVGLLSAGIPAWHLASIKIVDGLRKVS